MDPATGLLYDLAMYEPSETNPAYRCSVITNLGRLPGAVDAYGRCVRQAEALVKLEFIPARTDDDFVMLDNVEALELGIAGLRAERANNDALAEVKYAKAIRSLNLQIRDKNPGAQTAIRTDDMSQRGVLCNPI